MNIRFRRDRRRATPGSRAAPVRGAFQVIPTISLSANTMRFRAYWISIQDNPSGSAGDAIEVGFGPIGEVVGNVKMWAWDISPGPAQESLPNANVVENIDPTIPISFLEVTWPLPIFNPVSGFTRITGDIACCTSHELAGFVAGPFYWNTF